MKAAKATYVALAWAFLACIAVQVFLAGMGVFVSPRYFQSHAGFVHLFEWIPVAMLIAAFAGRLSPGLRWMTAGLWALIAVQYTTADFRFFNFSGAALISSLHPVTAMVLFWATVTVLGRARREVTEGSAPGHGASPGGVGKDEAAPPY